MAKQRTDQAVSSALERAAAYTLLAHCFAYPDEASTAALREAAAEAKSVTGDIAILRLASIADEARPEALELSFVAISTFSTSPDSPLFETAYFGGDPQHQTQRMADIAGFYRAFGVDSVGGTLRPDDLPVELEFMGYLCRKETYAVEHLGAPRAAQTRRAERLFLQEHLGCWAPLVASKLAESDSAGPFYRLCGETLRAWLAREVAETGAAPVPVVANIVKDWQRDSSHGPEFAGEPNFIPIEELV